MAAERLPETIQGKKVGSKNEARVALALDKLRMRYIYQYVLYGGRRVRGGQILDFLVFSPLAVPLQVFGEKWHKGELDPEERMELAMLAHYFKREVEIIWGRESETLEDAEAEVRRIFR